MFDSSVLIQRVIGALATLFLLVSTAHAEYLRVLPPDAVPVPPGFERTPKEDVQPKAPLASDYKKGKIVNRALESAGSISFDVSMEDLEKSGFECDQYPSRQLTWCATRNARSYSLLGRQAHVYAEFYRGLLLYLKFTITATGSEVRSVLTEVYGEPFRRIEYESEPLALDDQYWAWIFKDGSVVDLFFNKLQREVEINFHTPLYSRREYGRQFEAFGLNPDTKLPLDQNDL